MKKIAYMLCYGSFTLSALSTFILIAIAEEGILTANILGGIFIIIISLCGLVFLFYLDIIKNKNLIYLLLVNCLILCISFITQYICVKFNLLDYKKNIEYNLRYIGNSFILYVPTFFISLFGIALFYIEKNRFKKI